MFRCAAMKRGVVRNVEREVGRDVQARAPVAKSC
jgi:hypothetical protein